jgi:hypothetical protein
MALVRYSDTKQLDLRVASLIQAPQFQIDITSYNENYKFPKLNDIDDLTPAFKGEKIKTASKVSMAERRGRLVFRLTIIFARLLCI